MLSSSNYKITDLYTGLAEESGDPLFWLGRRVGIGSNLGPLTSYGDNPPASFIGILTGIAAVYVADGDRENSVPAAYYRLSIGNEVVICPDESVVKVFSKEG